MARKNKKLNRFFLLLRPRQWIKNSFVFAPLFLSGRIISLKDLGSVTAAFSIFCLLSSACYIFNDVLDYSRDKLHPSKRYRPVASGKVSRSTAMIISCLLFVIVFISAGYLRFEFLAVVSLYVALNLAYNFFFKKVIFLDIVSIGIGFLLRVYAGGMMMDVPISSWLALSVFSLAFFLSAGKRHGDWVLLSKRAIKQKRALLVNYQPNLLKKLILASLILVNVSYLLYAVSRGNLAMLYSWIFVLFGTIRYFTLLKRHPAYPDPTDLISKDRQLMAILILWFSYMVILHYGG